MKKPRTLHQQIPELRDALAKPKRERTSCRNGGDYGPSTFGRGNQHKMTKRDFEEWKVENAKRAEELRGRELRYKLSRLLEEN